MASCFGGRPGGKQPKLPVISGDPEVVDLKNIDGTSKRVRKYSIETTPGLFPGQSDDNGPGGMKRICTLRKNFVGVLYGDKKPASIRPYSTMQEVEDVDKNVVYMFYDQERFHGPWPDQSFYCQQTRSKRGRMGTGIRLIKLGNNKYVAA
jgi:hypothetical protein